MKLKVSKYNFYVENENACYVYNTLHTSIVELNKETAYFLKNNQIEKINNEYIETLKQQGFLTSSILDETDIFSYYYNSARFGDTADTLGITILPTYGCNLACPYCYQGQNKQYDKMSSNKLNAIVKFASNQIDANKPLNLIRRINLSFFGGEPLLFKDVVISACKKFSTLAKKRNLELFIDVTTNLTLINDDFIDAIKMYQIHVQVTIDGTKEDHNQRRIYKNGSGTYDLIIQNLKRLCEAGLKHLLTIRINVDDSNIKYADQMFGNAIKYADIVYFGYLKKYKNYNDNYQQSCISTDCFANAATDILNDVYEKYGVEIPLSFGKRAPCILNSQNDYIFDSKLDVYKCEILQNHPECKVGVLDLNGNLVINDNFYKQMSFVPWKFEKCKNCVLMPMCGAGCPGEAYIRNEKNDGDVDIAECIEDNESLKKYVLDYAKRNV